ncbi:hypothetical protein [Saccharomonospora iraqiensis]|uniref:hypothetical protein n=1 Tax=Saccharomonospora iraqiensis TaxID=52698 RepID=UPI001F320ACD|nr:hypothetical protein [Saccharomonospora iraqiensis]
MLRGLPRGNRLSRLSRRWLRCGLLRESARGGAGLSRRCRRVRVGRGVGGRDDLGRLRTARLCLLLPGSVLRTWLLCLLCRLLLCRLVLCRLVLCGRTLLRLARRGLTGLRLAGLRGLAGLRLAGLGLAGLGLARLPARDRCDHLGRVRLARCLLGFLG